MTCSLEPARDSMQAMRIVFFLYGGLTTLDIIGPHDVLSRLPGVDAISASKDGAPVAAQDEEILAWVQKMAGTAT